MFFTHWHFDFKKRWSAAPHRFLNFIFINPLPVGETAPVKHSENHFVGRIKGGGHKFELHDKTDSTKKKGNFVCVRHRLSPAGGKKKIKVWELLTLIRSSRFLSFVPKTFFFQIKGFEPRTIVANSIHSDEILMQRTEWQSTVCIKAQAGRKIFPCGFHCSLVVFRFWILWTRRSAQPHQD